MILHVVETRRFMAVGSDQESSSRFHLIASANGDLPRAVAEGRFRPDLYARLNQWAFRLPPLRERREDIEPNILHELVRAERLLGVRVGFNADAASRYLRFAQDPGTVWTGNFRDLGASVLRLCTLAPRARITLAMVEDEIVTLQAQWAGLDRDADGELLAELLSPRAEALDEFDSIQLAAVVRACQDCRSLSEAGRQLFARSRETRTSRNDADRLRKYLERFELTWAALAR